MVLGSSAMQNYVHLRKYNYNKYGIQTKDPIGGVVNQQVSYWTLKRDKIRQDFQRKAMASDIIEQTATGDMKTLSNFMQSLQEGVENNQSKYNELKNEIFQMTLGESWKILQNYFKINLATGAVSINKENMNGISGLTDFNLETLKRIGTNKDSLIYTEKLANEIKATENGYLQVSQYFHKLIRQCKSYATEIQNKISKNLFSQKELENFEKTFQEVDQKLSDLSLQIKKMNKNEKTAINAQFKLSKTKKQQSIYLKTVDKEIKNIANSILESYKKLQAPSLAKVQGDIMEAIVYVFYKTRQQGANVAYTTIVDNLGKTFTSGKVSMKYSTSDGGQRLQNALTKNNNFSFTPSDNNNIQSMDKIVSVTTDYNYSSQRKADIRLQATVQTGEDDVEKEIKNIGLSIKNYKSKNIHIVSGTSLYVLLFGGNFTSNEAWHLLNIYAEIDERPSRDGKDEKSIENKFVTTLTNLKNIAGDSLKAMILYSALTGKNVGKGVDNEAQYLVLNMVTSNRPPIFVSMDRLMNQLLQDTANNACISYGFGDSENKTPYPFANLTLINKMIPTNDDTTVEQAIDERLARLISQIHQLKISATITSDSVKKAAETIKK